MKRTRTQAERRTATRQALVEAAVRRLITHGFAGATVRDIARESGVSPGAVQYHFKSKEDIAIAALSHVFEEVAVRLHERDAELFDPHLARLRELIATAMRDGTAPRTGAAVAPETPTDPAQACAIFV